MTADRRRRVLEPAPGVLARTDGWRRLAPSSFRGTIVASTIALMAAAMVIVGLGIQLVLGYTAQRDIEQVLSDRSQAMLSVITSASTTGLTVPEDAVEPGVAVYDADGTRIAGGVESTVREVADRLGTTDVARTVSGPSDEERLLGTPFATPSGERGVLVVSQETGPYERSELYALAATVALGLVVVAAAAVMALRITRQALRPVTQMAERAAEWSEHDLSHRFALGPPSNELAALGETLDHLLDRVASAIRSEQRLTSELAHELRTPLTAIQGSADLALMRGVTDVALREDLAQISASAREMSGVIATLLDIARDAATDGRAQTCALADVTPAFVSAASGGVEVDDLTGSSSVRIAAPAALVIRAASPVLGNAVHHARSRVTLAVDEHHDHVDLLIRDDGPGVDRSVRDVLFDAGVSAREGGAGLGLGIARRVARSFGGDVTLDDPSASGPESGATFRISLPRR